MSQSRWLTLVVCLIAPAFVAAQQFLVAPGAGGSPVVRILDGTSDRTFFAYDPSFSGGVRIALGDVTGDGIVDIVTAAGPDGGPHVRVFNGATSTEQYGFFAYDEAFSGGVYVAAADVDGDGRSDIITGAGAGGAPHVRVINGVTTAEQYGFFAYDPAFPGGVRVAAGDVDGDGKADIITGAGPGGGPHVKVFSGADLHLLASFLAYAPSFAGGVSVAAGDFDGDGLADIATGPGPGGGPHVRVFSGTSLRELVGFWAFDPALRGGVDVSAGDVNGDGRTDLIAAAGPGGGPHVRIFDGATGTQLAGPFGSFFAFDPGFTGGTFVAAPVDVPPRVIGTNPPNASFNLRIDSMLSVRFSEPVTASPNAFALECPDGVPVPLVLLTTTASAELTVRPVSVLPRMANCTLFVRANEVFDADTNDPPDRLGTGTSIWFQTSFCDLITVTPTSVPEGTVGVPYGPVQFTWTGGVGPPIVAPWSWSAAPGGVLPPGLTLSPLMGQLSGTPTQAGSFPVVINAVTNRGACGGSVALTITIAPSP